ncbi:hypothetical protein PFLA_a1304 [Pseudoalteromonas flavipulchra NCIMB 2033 = ATCC BAA-314]|nr:hypothetical protein [Pseudoalteromonas flavipulchra NCIMB 2033 = ATCC BAA-314]
MRKKYPKLTAFTSVSDCRSFLNKDWNIDFVKKHSFFQKSK